MKHTTNPFTGDINTWETSLTECLEKCKFYNGRMISASKSMYYKANPKNKIYFNACIFANGIQVWYGDLDLTKDSKKLQKISNATNQIFYVTPEMFRSDFNKQTKETIENHEKTIIFKPNYTIGGTSK